MDVESVVVGIPVVGCREVGVFRVLGDEAETKKESHCCSILRTVAFNGFSISMQLPMQLFQAVDPGEFTAAQAQVSVEQ